MGTGVGLGLGEAAAELVALRIAHQLLIIYLDETYLDETLGRKHPTPVSRQALHRPDRSDQRIAARRKRGIRIEIGAVNRYGDVDGRAAAVDERRTRQHHVNQPRPQANP